jgi:hypothetical protein
VTRARLLVLSPAIVSWLALVTAGLVLALGPMAVPELGLSISRPSRLLFVSLITAGAALAASRSPRALLDDLASSPAPYVATLVFAVVLLIGLLLARGATNVGGADSAGYLAQAQRWQQGTVRVPLPLAIPDAADPWLQSGLGFRPDPSGQSTVPSYPPGLPWLQALALRLGGEAAAVRGVPVLAVLLAVCGVWLVARPHVGVDGAVLACVSLLTLPVFLFQALQPMSDVLALGLWLVALALAGRAGRVSLIMAALAVTSAVLVRPNLAPLALAVIWRGTQAAQPHAEAWRRGLTLAVGLAVAVAVVAAVQGTLYGSPFQSGYGRASELFSVRHVPANLLRYPGWVIESVSRPALALLIVGVVALLRGLVPMPWTRPATLMAALTAVLHLVYVPFDSWTYLRFVLVVLAVAAIGTPLVLAEAQRFSPARWRFPVFAALVLLIAVPNLQLAQALGVVSVRAREFRYEAAGRLVGTELPARAVIVAAQHSTSAPFYAGRPLLRADLLDAGQFAAVTAWSDRERRPLAFVLDVAEVDAVQARLGGSGLAALDWPPRAEIGRPVSTRVWLSSDRARWLAGAIVPTRRLVPATR